VPADPWLRVHLRARGRIEKVVPTSMVVRATTADWQRGTSIELATSGSATAPGAMIHAFLLFSGLVSKTDEALEETYTWLRGAFWGAAREAPSTHIRLRAEPASVCPAHGQVVILSRLGIKTASMF
jgi:hypothetical protein